MKILWSVIIPVYNSQKFLCNLLNSLPSRLPHDLEIIIVDDGSNDKTSKVFSNYKFKTTNYKLFKQKHLGAAAARNLGAKEAHGRWLIFFDVDVILNPKIFLNLKKYLQKYPYVRCLTGINTKKSSHSGIISQFRSLYSYFTLNLIPENGIASAWNPRVGVIEKKLFWQIGGFDTHFRGADIEDYVLSHRIAEITPIYFTRTFIIKHSFANFSDSTRDFFRRSKMWIKLFYRTRQFDQTGHTRIGMLPSFLVSFLLFLALFYQPMYFMVLLILHFLLNLKITAFFTRSEGLLKGLVFSLLIIYFNWVAQLGIIVGTYEYLTNRRSL